MKKLLLTIVFSLLFMCGLVTYGLDESMDIILMPGWNVVSTPQYLTSMSFSGGRDINTYIYEDNKWKPIAITDNFVLEPLQGYLMSNNLSNNITLTLNFDTNNTDLSTLQKSVKSGWNLLGIVSTDSPFKNIANSVGIKILDYTQMLSTNVSDAEYNFTNHVFMYSNRFYYDWLYIKELYVNAKEGDYRTYGYQLGEAYPVFLEGDGIYGTQPFPNKEIHIENSGGNLVITNSTDNALIRFTLESSGYINLLNDITFSITGTSIDIDKFRLKIGDGDGIQGLYFPKSIYGNDVTYTPSASHTNKVIQLRYAGSFTGDLEISIKSINGENKDYQYLVYVDDPILTISQQTPASNNGLVPAQYKVTKNLYSAIDTKISDLELWAGEERILHTIPGEIITDGSIFNDTFYETYGINDSTVRPITKIKYKIIEGDSSRDVEFLKSEYPVLFEIEGEPLKWWSEN